MSLKGGCVMKISRLGVIFFALWSGIHSAQALTLDQRWDLERRIPFQGFTPEVISILKNRHVFFISGIMNELADPQVLGIRFFKSYYKSNIRSVETELGMTYDYYGPNSAEAVEDNSEVIYEQLMRAYSHIGKPMIVMAHSKGGAEMLHTVLRHPELILRGYVDRVILVQAAIGGSPIITNTEDRGILYQAISWFVQRGIKSLEVNHSRRSFDLDFALYQERLNLLLERDQGGQGDSSALHQEVSSRIFYVRSHQLREHLSWGIRTVNQVCGVKLHDDGKNDGLLMLKHQKHPGIGVDLGVLRSDHIGLTVDYYSNISSAEKKAFTRALLAHVYSSDLELEDTSEYDEDLSQYSHPKMGLSPSHELEKGVW